MPISPSELFEQAGCRWTGAVPWRTRPRTNRPGVYVVSLSSDPTSASGLTVAPVNTQKVAVWIDRVPTFQLYGKRSPAAADVAAHMSEFWLAEESVVYIGKAGTSLANRVGQYYRTPLGDRKPHAGGHWIQTLDVLNNLTVHYGEVPDGDPEDIEALMMQVFMASASKHVLGSHPQPSLVLPFANLEGPGGRRSHGLSGTKLP